MKTRREELNVVCVNRELFCFGAAWIACYTYNVAPSENLVSFSELPYPFVVGQTSKHLEFLAIVPKVIKN